MKKERRYVYNPNPFLLFDSSIILLESINTQTLEILNVELMPPSSCSLKS